MKMFLWLLLMWGVLVMPAYAADVLPPPSASKHEAAIEQENAAPDTPETDLNKDLMPEENVEVRSYEDDNGDMITEYSMNGRVYAIRVQPIAGLPAYFLYDRDGKGLFERRLSGGYKRISPPMWVIKEF